MEPRPITRPATSKNSPSSLLEARNPLERLLGLFDDSPSVSGAVRIMGGQESRPAWLTSGDWQVFARPAGELVSGGREIAQFELPDGKALSASFDPARKSVFVPFDPAEAYINYLSEAWTAVGPRRGLSNSQLNAFYRVKRFIPRRLQIAGRRILTRRPLPAFPQWPIDTSVSRLLRFSAYCHLLSQDRREASFRWFWPAPYRAAAILTHDVEGAEGLPLAIEIADIEEEHGLRSSFNLGGWYDVDPGILRELTGRGFEIGLHGLRHDRALFSSRSEFDAQLPRLRSLASRFGAEGFRSPSTYRIFDWLAELPVSYDGSIPHSDPFEPQPGGCCSFWPFFIGDVVELPYTLPQDYTLFTLLGQRSPALWLELAERLAREHGLIHVLSHPDRGYLGDPEKRAAYREFLAVLSERDEVWKPLPRELAAWWRLRDTSEPDDSRVAHGVVAIGETDGCVDLQPPPNAQESAREATSLL